MSVDRASLLPWIALASVPALSGADFRRLLAAFGSPARIVACSQHELARLVDAQTAEAIRRSPESPAAQAGLDWIAQPDRDIVTLADERYPALLRETPDPPPVLYAWGSIQLLARTAFAIVGSRNASAQGAKSMRWWRPGPCRVSASRCCGAE